MSTRQDWELSLVEQRRQEARAELERRRLELARLRAERAAATHHQLLQIERESNRLATEQKAQQSASLAQARHSLAGLEGRTKSAGIELDRLDSKLEQSRAELATVQGDLRGALGKFQELQHGTNRLAEELRNTQADAEKALGLVDVLSRSSSETVTDLLDSAATGWQARERQGELEERIQGLESTLRFLTQDESLAPVAMVALQAMEENGYQLQSTSSREGLVLYFQKEEASHYLAVRMAATGLAEDPGSTATAQQWDLLAETFGIDNEICLGEMEDFETALSMRARISRKGGRIYPRKDRHAVLESPSRGRRMTPANQRQHRKKTRDG